MSGLFLWIISYFCRSKLIEMKKILLLGIMLLSIVVIRAQERSDSVAILHNNLYLNVTDFNAHQITGRDVVTLSPKLPVGQVTFDLEAFVAKIREVLDGGTVGWPTYDRHLHNPIEDAITVTGDIVILEGNYLLLDEDGWRDLHKMADYTIFLRGDEDVLRGRLVDRKEASGNSREKAEAFVDFSDMRNVRLCLNNSLPADLELKLKDFA